MTPPMPPNDPLMSTWAIAVLWIVLVIFAVAVGAWGEQTLPSLLP